LENQHIEDANGDGGVGEVKDGPEEDEMVVGAEEEGGQPGGVFAGNVDDGEVEHVDHATMQPSGIAAAVGEEGGDLRIGALAEDATIEHAVDDVAHGSRGDKGDAEHHAEFGVFLREADQHPEEGYDGHDPKEAQCQFQEAAAAQPTEGHAVVLDEQQLEPASDDRNLLSKGHIRLDPNLEDLVEYQDDEDHQKRPPQAVVALLFHFFFSLASRQRVVMGTQRSLSLGMRRPVSQQMP